MSLSISLSRLCAEISTGLHRPSDVDVNIWASSSQTRQPGVRDLITKLEVQIGDGSASSSQTRHPYVRDLVAASDVQSGDSTASSSQTHQPCVRDLMAPREV